MQFFWAVFIVGAKKLDESVNQLHLNYSNPMSLSDFYPSNAFQDGMFKVCSIYLFQFTVCQTSYLLLAVIRLFRSWFTFISVSRSLWNVLCEVDILIQNIINFSNKARILGGFNFLFGISLFETWSYFLEQRWIVYHALL